MRPSSEEMLIRETAFVVANGLRGEGEHKLAKRLELTAGDGRDKILEVLTIIERTPGLPWRCFKMVAMGKMVINGDVSWVKPLRAHVDYANGMGPMPDDEPN
jgi:hypothetical protein